MAESIFDFMPPELVDMCLSNLDCNSGGLFL